MITEIGSHFELDKRINELPKKKAQWLPPQYDLQYTFSGRSAIELAIMDMKVNRNIKSVYMPSYCCKTMVEPFINNDIEVSFYEVFYEEGKGIEYRIDTDFNCDVFYSISYFGIEQFKQEPFLKEFKKKNTIILEDITHSLLNSQLNTNLSDYCIASLRKWLPITTGGLVAKQKGEFNIKTSINSNDLTEFKIKAMKEKANYLNGEKIDKQSFLKKMIDFEKKLGNKDYRYKIDDFSKEVIDCLDIELLKDRRRSNFKRLYEGIKDLKHIYLLIPDFDLHNNTPMFLPLIMESRKRDELRTFLIQHNVYCPVHWPKVGYDSSSISLNEISLVCDQRYSKKDMNHMVKLIKSWHESAYKDN